MRGQFTSLLKQIRMEESIAVCIVGIENNIVTKYVVNNLLEKTKCNIHIYLLLLAQDEHGDYGYQHEKVSVICRHNTEDKKYTLCDLVNENFNRVKEDYCVLFPCNALVNDNWCEDLLFNIKNLKNTGCVGIRSLGKKADLSSILNTHDELSNVWMTENNVVDGIVMVETKHIKGEVGMYDKWFDETGFEQIEFTLKFAFAGMNNFYIRKQSYIPLDMENETLFPKPTKKGLEMINDFVKANINFENGGN